jgi:delta8-fatty-acid desaturase
MRSYIIGRIDGHWDNFVPPLQGGKFRPYDGANDPGFSRSVTIVQYPAESESSSASISSRSSDDGFPLIDPSLRRRRVESSASSMTSVSLDPTQFDGEELTQNQIDEDMAKYPALDYTTQRDIVRKYRELEKRIRAEGLYNCNYWAYGRECTRYVGLFIGCMLCLHYGWYKTSALLLGCFWHQLVFSAHDAGHMGITHNFQVDTCIGIFIADFCGGLSLGWWKRNHNVRFTSWCYHERLLRYQVHHIVTNDPEHDPDIEHMPFFAISHRFFNSLFSTYYDRVMSYDAAARFFVRYQNYLYYPIMFLGRFNLYRLSFEYLFLGLGPRKGIAAWHRYLELSGLVVFWYWFGYGILYHGLPTNWDRFAYVMISHMVTMPLHVQITLSHFAMSTADLGITESFPQKMLRTTMDVDCSEWLDFFHGGLQFQVYTATNMTSCSRR